MQKTQHLRPQTAFDVSDRPADPVGMALWLIESNLTTGISLDEIATATGLSRFQLSRQFGRVIGWPVMAYLRARRLSEAARMMAAGADDILAVALDAGYGSHEAFTRAFRDHFGLAPESLRALASTETLTLMEPRRMDMTDFVTLDAARFVMGTPMLIAGLSERYSFEDVAGIPAQWQRFGPHIGHVPDQRGTVCYGLCHNYGDNGQFNYLCGVEIARADNLPSGFTLVRLVVQTYAVFTHRNHISTIGKTMRTIWQKWLPSSGYRFAEAPEFERYDDRFDPMTGNGEVEIWLPVTKPAVE
jgi:AraC family transcriptional regulator